ncbi:MAG: hypothetical protein JRH01_26290 [Deltaproteobacteria bacterium]|nr:hypothetical protein [Deltaproteobacteria bacterium]
MSDSTAAAMVRSDDVIAWCSYWLAPNDTPIARYRFAVQTLQGRMEHSPGFETDGQAASTPGSRPNR